MPNQLNAAQANAARPEPVFRIADEVLLTGTMAIYDTQEDASANIPPSVAHISADFIPR